MDFFTHALLPYLLASSLGWERRWMAALVLGGIAPDLDVLFSWAGSILPPYLLMFHRGMTHSLFFRCSFRAAGLISGCDAPVQGSPEAL
ncbi:MAG: metal-dependent hydrolase [Methanothrix sp.]|jgi:inner membrane protein